MSSAKFFPIKESATEIKKLMKSSSSIILKRLQALLIFKKNEESGISKRLVAEELGVNHNSIQTWRSKYVEGGIEMLMSHDNIGYKPSIITTKQEQALKKQLNDPYNGMVGFVELLAWFNNTFDTDINYKTFHGFVVRKFSAKIKVARKTHIHKDLQAVEELKKTLHKSVKKSSLKKAMDSKK